MIEEGDMGAKGLPPPDQTLAKRALAEVDFDRRLCGYIVHERTGPILRPLYSLAEVYALLSHPFPHLPLEDLCRWLAEVIEDQELAQAVAITAAGAGTEAQRMKQIREIIGERLTQCRQLLGSDR